MNCRAIRILELRSVVGAGGGPEKTILVGAQLADPQRFRVTVCYLHSANDRAYTIGDRATALGLDYVGLAERSAIDRGVWRSLRQLIRSRSIDIIHAHDYKTDVLALLLARAEGVVPITTAHGWTGHSWRERLFYYPLDKQVIRAFPYIIAVSEQIKADLLSAGVPADRVRVVLNGIDPAAHVRDRARVDEIRRKFGIHPRDIVIGAAGRLEPQKRFDLLIRACAALRERYPTVRLLIAGEGSRRSELQTLAADLLPGQQPLLGHLGDVRVLHHALDFYVQTSDYEGTPNAVLEAMAMETPIVATAAGGTAQVAQHVAHALIVPVGDLAALVAAIDHAIVNLEETAARVHRARCRVQLALSFANRMAAVDAVYESAAASRLPHPTLTVADPCA